MVNKCQKYGTKLVPPYFRIQEFIPVGANNSNFTMAYDTYNYTIPVV